MSAPAPGRGVAPAAPGTIPGDVRQAALLLHAMPAPDRTWLVAQLPPRERAILQELLTELERLGMPADRTLLDEAIATRVAPTVATAAAPGAGGGRTERSGESGSEEGAETDRGALAQADPVRLAALLRNEPAQLIALLFGLCDWPWRSAVLQRIGAAKRVEVERLLAAAPGAGRASVAAPSPSCPPALGAELIRVVLRRVGEARRHEQRGTPGAGRALRALLGSWRRA